MTRREDALANSTSDASLARSKARSAEIDLAIDQDPSRFRVLTGDRPTGHLTWATTSAPCATGRSCRTGAWTRGS